MKNCSKRAFTSGTRPALESKMKEYIFGERNGIYIIDCKKR